MRFSDVPPRILRMTKPELIIFIKETGYVSDYYDETRSLNHAKGVSTSLEKACLLKNAARALRSQVESFEKVIKDYDENHKYFHLDPYPREQDPYSNYGIEDVCMADGRVYTVFRRYAEYDGFKYWFAEYKCNGKECDIDMFREAFSKLRRMLFELDEHCKEATTKSTGSA